MSFTRRLTPLIGRRAFSSTPSSQLARIQLIGRLAADPELRTTSAGKEYLRYTLAVGSGPRDDSGQQHTSWYRIANFNPAPEGTRAREFLAGMQKGTLVYVEGDASLNTYVDKDTGKNVSALNVVQRSVEILKGRAREENAPFTSDGI